MAEISERNVVVAILEHLKFPTEALPLARARSPAFEGAYKMEKYGLKPPLSRADS